MIIFLIRTKQELVERKRNLKVKEKIKELNKFEKEKVIYFQNRIHIHI